MILAISGNPMEEVMDHPWMIHGQQVPWLSNQISSIVIVGLLLMIALPMMARRRGLIPRGPYRLLEVMLLFVRNSIATPAMGPLGQTWLPFIASLFYFVLGLNLFGLIPLVDVSNLVGLSHTPIGGTGTATVPVTAALAGMTFLLVMFTSYGTTVKELWKGSGHGAQHGHPMPSGHNYLLALANFFTSRTWPLPVAVVAGVFVWLNRFVPPIAGLLGMFLWPVLLGMELVGYVARCFALCIRLFVNMVSGHVLLAVLILMAAEAAGWAITYVSLPAALGSVAILMLETLVAVMHAFIFTFLSALFIAMAANPQH